MSWRSLLSCWVREQQRQRRVRSGELFCDGQWRERAVQCMPCRGVLFAGLLVSKRERALSCGKLFDVWQRQKRSVHALSRGNVQHYGGIHVCCIVPCVPCWSVLPRWMQRVERERRVSCWQLFDCGQRGECVV